MRESTISGFVLHCLKRSWNLSNWFDQSKSLNRATRSGPEP
jgi:hypothetical protein